MGESIGILTTFLDMFGVEKKILTKPPEPPATWFWYIGLFLSLSLSLFSVSLFPVALLGESPFLVPFLGQPETARKGHATVATAMKSEHLGRATTTLCLTRWKLLARNGLCRATEVELSIECLTFKTRYGSVVWQFASTWTTWASHSLRSTSLQRVTHLPTTRKPCASADKTQETEKGPHKMGKP